MFTYTYVLVSSNEIINNLEPQIAEAIRLTQ